MPTILTKHLIPLRSKKTGLLAGQEAVVRDIAQAVKHAQRVLLGTHEHPDGDALGSILALTHALKAQGKQVTAYIPDAAADFYAFMPGINELTTTKPDPNLFDCVIVLDYTQLYRTHLEAEIINHPCTICIDHHYDNPKQTTLNLVVPAAAATAQIIFELFETWHWDVTQDVATCLLTGIFTDTGSFMHESVTPDILAIASKLMSKGARLSHIAHETYQRKDLSGLQIWGRALSRIITNEKTGVSVALVTLQDLAECKATLDDLSGVVNLLNTLPNTNYAMLLVEYLPGKIKGSLRSEPHKNTDVSKIAKHLGGGGHKLASGFEIEGRIIEKDGVWHIAPPVQP